MPNEQQRTITNTIGIIYAAAVGEADWYGVGDQLCALVGAQRAALRLTDGVTVSRSLFREANPSTAVEYGTYYHTVDPYRIEGRRRFIAAGRRDAGRSKLGADLVPDSAILDSEFYVDFSRRSGQRHLLGAMLGIRQPTPIGLYRPVDAKPFGRRECRLLDAVLPHLQRALELGERLGARWQASRLSAAVLDTLAVRVALVDGDMNLLFANVAASRYLAGRDACLSVTRNGPGLAVVSVLSARHRDDAEPLRRLVASAASGAAGGTLRLHHGPLADGGASSQVVFVSPVIGGWLDEAAGRRDGHARGLALVIIENRLARPPLPTDLLCAVFGFSKAEAAVAARLAGGAKAEDVARFRHVSLDTVRSQIRSILAKSGAANLRDFERQMAVLAAVMPAPANGD